MLPIPAEVEAMLPRHHHHRVVELKSPAADEILGRQAQRESCLPNLDGRRPQAQTTRTIFHADWKRLQAVEEIGKPEIVNEAGELADHGKQTLVGPAFVPDPTGGIVVQTAGMGAKASVVIMRVARKD